MPSPDPAADGAQDRGSRERILAASAVSLLLALLMIQCVLSMRDKTPTVDEFVFVPVGCLYWRTGDFALERRTPPLAKLLMTAPVLAMRPRVDENVPCMGWKGPWLPWFFGDFFMRRNGRVHLTGNSHSNLPDDPNILSCDVGVDAWNMTPVSMAQLRAVMAKKTPKPQDHHGRDQDE